MTTTNFHAKSTALEVIKGLNAKLDGKVVIVTGATSGIGVETARAIASANAHTIITARDINKGKQAVEDIKKTTSNQKVEVMEMDLNSLQSVRNFVSQFRARKLPINILICNAGIMACPYAKTVDGFESQFGVNHLAHFLLTSSLIPELKAGKPARVVLVSSIANKRGGINWEKNYNKWSAYAQSKTANILSWISLSVYFLIVLLIIILLCGIQFNKPWLVFLWSILMIVMLLADGIITVLSLRHHQQEAYQPSIQVKILFFIMIIRLVLSLCGIFITIFHFRQLNKAQSEYLNRQRMLVRYNTESVSPSYDNSWTRSGALLNPSKDSNDDHFIPDLLPSTSLPRAKVATIQRRPISATFHSQLEYPDHPHQLPINECNEDFLYNIPLQERFHQKKITDVQEL